VARQLYRFNHERLRNLVEASGKSLELIAIETGRTRPAVEAWLRGRSIPPATVLPALCRSLGCRQDDLLEELPDAEHDALVHEAMVASRSSQGLPTTLPDSEVEAAAELLRLHSPAT
jgi:transcriptional regulator with XRE-family HTH domain